MIRTLNKYHYLPLLIVCGYYLFQSYFFEIHDYANYYFGGKFLNEGIFNTQIYFPYSFNKTISDFGYENIFVSYAPNTPSLALFFWLFSFLEIGVSKLIFNSISVSLFIVAIYKLSNYHQINKNHILLIPLLFFIPIKNNLLFGQVYFLIFFLLSEAYLAYQKNNHKSLAVFLSLAIFLKVFPILLVCFLIVKKRYLATIYVTLSCVCLLFISICITGLDVWLFYFSSVLKRAGNGEIAGAFVDNYQSYYMFFKRLFVYDETYNQTTILNSTTAFTAIILFIKLFLIGTGILITKKQYNDIVTFSFWILISILISPYGSTYSLLLLLFLFFSFSKDSPIYNYKISEFVLLFFISNSTILPKVNFPFNYMRILFLSVALVFLLWNFKKQIQLKKLFISIAVFATMVAVFKTKEVHFNTNIKTPILTYNYELKNNKISYSYWNENGESRKEEKYTYQSLDSNNVTIIDHQIYYKETQITYDNSNKKKAILIDNKKIIFLSDATIGIGFYGIKELDL